MSNIAIKVQGLTKVYEIAHVGTSGTSLRETLEYNVRLGIARALGRTSLPRLPPREEVKSTIERFKAIEEISFEVKQGERLAVIGKNGAGKSTLLKILSHVTEPTGGSVTIRGRVSSLLEVGTGFHPELTGRENVFLNGAVLGMPKSEIRAKFDEIVEFSEVEKFLDTPVKYYSSGMYVRLAFAVAAHLDPDVMILDEVLAVGDLRFQQKCLARMQYASKEGRTVLFVSHGMQAVMQICPEALLLENGRVKQRGPSAEVIKTYLGQDIVRVEAKENVASPGRYIPGQYIGGSEDGDDFARLISASILDKNSSVGDHIPINEPMFLAMEFEVLSVTTDHFVPNFHIYTAEGVLAMVVTPPNSAVQKYEPGVYRATCEVPANLLNEGSFRVLVALSSSDMSVRIHFLVSDALNLTIFDDLTDLSWRNGYLLAIPGVIRPRFLWDVRRSG